MQEQQTYAGDDGETVLPESKIPDEIHSKTRLRASPGLRGAEALLMAFSTSSSMAWTVSQRQWTWLTVHAWLQHITSAHMERATADSENTARVNTWVVLGALCLHSMTCIILCKLNSSRKSVGPVDGINLDTFTKNKPSSQKGTSRWS